MNGLLACLTLALLGGCVDLDGDCVYEEASHDPGDPTYEPRCVTPDPSRDPRDTAVEGSPVSQNPRAADAAT